MIPGMGYAKTGGLMNNDGGPAFPIPGAVSHFDDATITDSHHSGMSLRDWFAGQALIAIAADHGKTPEQRAEEAYQYSDAMLKEREK